MRRARSSARSGSAATPRTRTRSAPCTASAPPASPRTPATRLERSGVNRDGGGRYAGGVGLRQRDVLPDQPVILIDAAPGAHTIREQAVYRRGGGAAAPPGKRGGGPRGGGKETQRPPLRGGGGGGGGRGGG